MSRAATPPFTLDTAIALARERHLGQFEVSGRPYIEHPLRVMNKLQSTEARMAGVLHDTLEDTSLTVMDLVRLGCPQRVIAAVVAVTHDRGEPRGHYLDRVLRDPLALEVKWADLSDHRSPDHVAWMREHLPERAEHFKRKDSYAVSYLVTRIAGQPGAGGMVERLLVLLRQIDPAAALRATVAMGSGVRTERSLGA